MGLDDQILFTIEWITVISFGLTMILFFHSLLFN
jgi:hypothetical protein